MGLHSAMATGKVVPVPKIILMDNSVTNQPYVVGPPQDGSASLVGLVGLGCVYKFLKSFQKFALTKRSHSQSCDQKVFISVI